jgi:RNA polymerase sigma factor (sigma-70 family)
MERSPARPAPLSERPADGLMPPGEPAPEQVCTESVPSEWDWSWLYDSVRPVLIRKASARFGFSTEDAEDIVQDVFEDVIRRSPRVRSPQKYLLGAVYNVCFERLRGSGAARRATVELDEWMAVDTRSVERLQDRCTARGVFQRIDPQCRKLVRRYCIEERSLKETAEEAGVTVNAVWKRIQQCLRSMNLFFERAEKGILRRLSSSPSRSGGR